MTPVIPQVACANAIGWTHGPGWQEVQETMNRPGLSSPRVGRAVRRSEGEWLAMSEDPAFRALVSRKRRFMLSAWLLVAAAHFSLAVTGALAPDWFARLVLGELNLGLLLALCEVILVLAVAGLYVHRAQRDFDRSAIALARRFRGGGQ